MLTVVAEIRAYCTLLKMYWTQNGVLDGGKDGANMRKNSARNGVFGGSAKSGVLVLPNGVRVASETELKPSMICDGESPDAVAARAGMGRVCRYVVLYVCVCVCVCKCDW